VKATEHNWDDHD